MESQYSLSYSLQPAKSEVLRSILKHEDDSFRMLRRVVSCSHQGDLMMEAVNTSETSADLYDTTWHNIPEDSHWTSWSSG
jgi:hypothetical protein